MKGGEDMGNTINNEALVKDQYKNSDNLNARLNFHSFNINKTDWNQWFFEKMNMPDHGNVLELGCGNGLLWKKNEKSIKKTLNITLSDFSEGMLESAKKNINNENIKYEVIDIQNIPYEDESFDVIIARHMLYHVPDIDKALSEVKRVLKPNGKFYVSTNSLNHLRELKILVKNFDKTIDFDPARDSSLFGIENGGELLKKHFGHVALEEFNGQIVVHEAEPVVSYVTSVISVLQHIIDENKLDSFTKYVEAEIDKTGEFTTSTGAGIFIASNL